MSATGQPKRGVPSTTGSASTSKACSAARVRAYPTWDFNGDRREGVLTIEELAVWSGFPTKASAGGKGNAGSASTR